MISFNTFVSGAKVIKKCCIRYAPQILTGLGIFSMGAATVCGIKTAPKAKKAIDEIEADNSISHKEAAKKKTLAYAKFYWPELLMTFGGAGLIIGGQHISLGRLSTAVGLLGIEKDKVKKLTDKISEKYGDKELIKLKDEIARDEVAKSGPPDLSKVYNTGHGTMYVYDAIGKRFILDSVEHINKAERQINQDIAADIKRHREAVYSLNNLYEDYLGWPPLDGRVDIPGIDNPQKFAPNIGKDLGWRNRFVELKMTYGNFDPDHSYVIVGFSDSGGPNWDLDITDDFGSDYQDDETDMPWR